MLRWSGWLRENPSRRTSRRLEAAVNALQLTRGTVVAEIGCGIGASFLYLHRAIGLSGRIVAIDASPRRLREARHRSRLMRWRNVDLVCAAPDRLPLKSDSVGAAFGLRNCPDSGAASHELRRIVKPGGTVGHRAARRTRIWFRSAWWAARLTGASGHDSRTPAARA